MLNCQPNRRQFISTLAAGAVVAGLGRSAAASFQPGVRTRKDVSGLNANSPEIKAYRKAVGKMRQLPDANPLSWRSQAFIHGRDNSFNDCQHRSWYFHPWHRAYLHYFEEIIRELSDDESFALPYWNWSQTRSIPGFFFGANNPLNDKTRLVNQNDQISADDVREWVGINKVVGPLIRNPDYTTFGGDEDSSGEDEFRPHNFIHLWIGLRPGQPFGNMRLGHSPLDPIFWLHHCNIDRHFSNWLALKHRPPIANNWLNKSFAHFFDRQGKDAGGNLPVRKMLRSEDLGYDYEAFDVPVPTPTPTPGPGILVAKLLASRAMLSDEIAPFASAPISDPRMVNTFRAIAADQGAKQSVRLRIKNLKAPKNQEDQNVAIRVFVNCLDPSPRTPITDPTYAGSFTFFDLPHADEEHHPSTVVLDATSAFRRVYGGKALDANETVRVSLVSVPLFGEGEGGVLKEVDPQQVEIEVISYG